MYAVSSDLYSCSIASRTTLCSLVLPCIHLYPLVLICAHLCCPVQTCAELCSFTRLDLIILDGPDQTRLDYTRPELPLCTTSIVRSGSLWTTPPTLSLQRRCSVTLCDVTLVLTCIHLYSLVLCLTAYTYICFCISVSVSLYFCLTFLSEC